MSSQPITMRRINVNMPSSYAPFMPPSLLLPRPARQGSDVSVGRGPLIRKDRAVQATRGAAETTAPQLPQQPRLSLEV